MEDDIDLKCSSDEYYVMVCPKNSDDIIFLPHHTIKTCAKNTKLTVTNIDEFGILNMPSPQI